MPIDREQLNLGAQRALVRIARRLGWHLVRADYYSPIVDYPVSTKPAPMPGVELDLDAQLELIETQLKPHLGGWRASLNPFYGPLDAELLYTLIRHLKPRRVLELGSGHSSLVVDEASRGLAAQHRIADPFPSPLLAGRLEVERIGAEALALERFTELEARDILFVDSTHTVKPGGEVVRLVLEILPLLQPGVVVHFHDIFRPFEYPQLIYERYNKHWQEHHLLQAFLAFNPGFRVIAAAHALARLRFEEVRSFAPGLTREMSPSAFWIEKL